MNEPTKTDFVPRWYRNASEEVRNELDSINVCFGVNPDLPEDSETMIDQITQPDALEAKRSPVVELMDPMMVEVMREKTPAQRLAIAFRMWDSARLIVKGGVQYQHPEWDDEAVEREIAIRMRGNRNQ